MIKKIMKKRWVCSIGGILLFAGILYLGYGIYGWVFRQTYKVFDVFMLALMAMVIAFVLYIAGMGKDFLRGFIRAFSTKGKGVSRLELCRAVKAIECAEKTAIIIGIIVCMMDILEMAADSLTYTSDALEHYIWLFSMPLMYLCSNVMYPALFILVMIPIKLRLERKVISYMEEPEDLEAEKAQADGQKIYFGLRAMGLTDREAEVARMAGGGLSNREIGQQLYIAEGTVKKHMTHILEKSGCTDREALRERIRGMYQG